MEPEPAVAVTINNGDEEEADAQPQPTESPPLTPDGRHRRWKRLAIFLLATVAVAGLLAFRWYRGGRNGLESIHGQHHDLQGGCHAPFNIDLWPQYDKGDPFLTAYVPPADSSTGASVVIAPGGSYWGVSFGQEGDHYARWLCAHGVASYVLTYRCAGTGYHAPVPETDGRRAMRNVRNRLRPSVDDTHKVGMIGSSAGGHLTATVLAYHDEGDAHATDPIERQSSRPDFGVLVYPVITMEDEATHPLSKIDLLGPGLTLAQSLNLTEHYSIEKHVRRHFPPTFIFDTMDDAAVPAENSIRMAQALTDAKVHHELAMYEHGQHGQDLGEGSEVTEDGVLLNGHPWTTRCLSFLAELGMLDRPN